MIIDFHTHCFPDALAPHAIEAMSESAKACPKSAGFEVCYNGTLDELLRIEHEDGVDYVVQMSVATNPHHQYKVNQFAIKVNNRSDMFAFGSVHGAASDSLEELERLYDAGIPGIKLHFDEMGIDMDDKKWFPVYDLISELGLPCMIHTGFDPFSPNHLHASPDMVMKIHREFPKLKLILAHLGGLLEWEGGETLAGQGMMMDTAMVSVGLAPEDAARIIRKNGVENVLMGSDMPWTTPKTALDYLYSLPLTDREKEMIAGENAAKLLGLV